MVNSGSNIYIIILSSLGAFLKSRGMPSRHQQGVAAKLDNVTNQIVLVNEVKAGSAPLQKNTQKNIPEIGHFRSPQVMMPKNSAIRSFFCKCLIN